MIWIRTCKTKKFLQSEYSFCPDVEGFLGGSRVWNCLSRCCGVSLAHDKTWLPNEWEVIAAGFSARKRVGDISLSPHWWLFDCSIVVLHFSEEWLSQTQSTAIQALESQPFGFIGQRSLCTLGTVLFEEQIAVVSPKKLDQERQDIQNWENPHLWTWIFAYCGIVTMLSVQFSKH